MNEYKATLRALIISALKENTPMSRGRVIILMKLLTDLGK